MDHDVTGGLCQEAGGVEGGRDFQVGVVGVVCGGCWSCVVLLIVYCCCIDCSVVASTLC